METEGQLINTPHELLQTAPSEPIVPEPPSPDNPPWSSWAAVGVWALSIAFIVVIPLVFLLPYLISNGVSFADKVEFKKFVLTDPTAVSLQLGPILLAHLFTLVVAWMVVTNFNTYSFRQTLGWEWNGFKIWHAVLVIVGFHIVATILVSIFGKIETDFHKMLAGSRTAVYFVAFFATFTAPITEEVVYRGLLYSAFQRRFGVVIAGILATVLFVTVHISQYSDGSSPDYVTVFMLLLLSIVLTLIRIKTGSLLPCFVLHTLFNGVQAVFLILEPYLYWLFDRYLKSPEVVNPVGAICRMFQ